MSMSEQAVRSSRWREPASRWTAASRRRGLAALGGGAERAGGGAAIDDQRVAGDERRRVTRQEEGGVGDVERLPDLRQRLGIQQEALDRLAVGGPVPDDGRGDAAG